MPNQTLKQTKRRNYLWKNVLKKKTKHCFFLGAGDLLLAITVIVVSVVLISAGGRWVWYLIVRIGWLGPRRRDAPVRIVTGIRSGGGVGDGAPAVRRRIGGIGSRSVTGHAAGPPAHVIVYHKVAAALARAGRERFVAAGLAGSRNVPVDVAAVRFFRTRARPAHGVSVPFWLQPFTFLTWSLILF